MPQRLEKFQRWLRNLQHSDRARKRRWLIGLTSAAMVVVFILWLVYINIYSVPVLVQASPQKRLVNEDSGESVLEILRRGLNEIFSDVKEQFNTSKNIIQQQLQKTNELIIEGEDQNQDQEQEYQKQEGDE